MGSALYQGLYGEGITLDQVQEIATGTSQANRNVSISVAHIEDLDFQVSGGAFYLAGVRYEITGEVVTLSAADGSNPRFDVIVAETDGTAGVVTGTPAADPAVPEVNPDTQFALVEVLVGAGASAPSDITDTVVYDEDDDWTSSESDSGTTIDLASTDDPNNGTVHIEFAAVVDGDYIELEDSSTHSPTEFESLVFAIKPTVAETHNQNRVRIGLYSDTTRVGDWIDLRHGSYSYSGSDTSAYQNIIIPVADFNLAGDQFDTVRFQVATKGSDTLSFNLDDIKFQTGAGVVFQGVTQEDVDLAVLEKPEQISLACTAIDGDIEAATTYARWVPRFDIEITDVYGSVETAPTGSAAIIDIHAGGTTIMSTNKINIDASDTDSTDASTQPALTTTTVAAGTEILIIVDQAGSSTAGAGLVVDIMYHQR